LPLGLGVSTLLVHAFAPGGAMDTRNSDVNMLCPTCKYGVGHPYAVAINFDFKIVHLRCPDCGREWRVRETFTESPGKGSAGISGNQR
jgi:hypothetical protein